MSLALFLLTLGAAIAAAPPAATASVATSSPLRTVDTSFLGVNIDSASLTNSMDLTDPYLTLMASQLSGASSSGGSMHLRVGGSASNGLFYDPQGVPGRSPHGGTCVTDASLAALDAFAARVNARLTFCIPYQTRNGKWEPSVNASALWAMVGAKNLSRFSGWSLGNEIIGGKGFDDVQYAADYIAFRAAVSAEAPDWAQDVVGPSAAGWPGDAVMVPFLRSIAQLSRTSISIHAYSFGNCTLDTYLSKAGMERMAHYYSAFVSERDASAPGLPVYLEEFATQAGGGCDGLSNRFVSGFWFLHALGLAGRMGILRVTRQDLAGWSFSSGVSHYTLSGPPGWNNAAADGLPTPHPDWFTAVLWRQLVGDRVLDVALQASAAINDTFAVHAWCAAPAAAPAGAVVLIFINTDTENVLLALSGGLTADAPRVEFLLTAPGGNMTADALLLNGVALGVDAEGRLPQQPLPGKSVPAGGASLTLPARSYGFVLLPGAQAVACVGKRAF